MPTAPVLAAGVGVRHGRGWALRSASFRLDASAAGGSTLGIAIGRADAATAVVDLLAGLTPPTYGELRVLGEDLSTPSGRAAVRSHVGIARKNARPQSAFRVRGLIEHAARLARLPSHDRHLLAAAILDRLALTPWAEVPLWAAPDTVCRRARLAAAAVHQPSLLLIDGLLDDLAPRDATALADGVRDLGRDTAIVAAGCDVSALALACDEILTLADGILISDSSSAQTRGDR